MRCKWHTCKPHNPSAYPYSRTELKLIIKSFSNQYYNYISSDIQDSRGSLHRSSGPAGVFAQFDAVPDIAESTGGSGSPLSTLGMRCSNNGLTAKNPFDSINRVNEHDAVAADIALFNEFNTAGSLFSIHSAPPVQITDMGNIAINDTTPTNANGIRWASHQNHTNAIFIPTTSCIQFPAVVDWIRPDDPSHSHWTANRITRQRQLRPYQYQAVKSTKMTMKIY